MFILRIFPAQEARVVVETLLSTATTSRIHLCGSRLMRKGLRQASRSPRIDRAFEEGGTNLANWSSSRESFLVKLIKGPGKEAGPSAARGVGLFTICLPHPAVIRINPHIRYRSILQRIYCLLPLTSKKFGAYDNVIR